MGKVTIKGSIIGSELKDVLEDLECQKWCHDTGWEKEIITLLNVPDWRSVPVAAVVATGLNMVPRPPKMNQRNIWQQKSINANKQKRNTSRVLV